MTPRNPELFTVAPRGETDSELRKRKIGGLAGRECIGHGKLEAPCGSRFRERERGVSCE